MPSKILCVAAIAMSLHSLSQAQEAAANDSAVTLVGKLSYKDAGAKAKMQEIAERFSASVAENVSAGEALGAAGEKEPVDRIALRQAMTRFVKSDEALDPFTIGTEQADKLRAAGKTMAAPIDFSLCDGTGACTTADPIVVFFFALGKALEGEINQKKPFGKGNDLVKFLQRPAGGSGSDLVKVRESALRALGIGGKNNDLAKVIRNPGNEVKKQAGKVQKAIRKAFRL